MKIKAPGSHKTIENGGEEIMPPRLINFKLGSARVRGIIPYELTLM